jgi:hypothetical protein
MSQRGVRLVDIQMKQWLQSDLNTWLEICADKLAFQGRWPVYTSAFASPISAYPG